MLSVCEITMKEEQQVQRIKKELLALGPMLPGSLSQQWNVCGTPGCQCKDSRNPVRHGPYYQLSFSVKGKSSTLFVRPDEVPAVQIRIQRYQRFKELVMALTQAYVELARKQRSAGRLEP